MYNIIKFGYTIFHKLKSKVKVKMVICPKTLGVILQETPPTRSLQIITTRVVCIVVTQLKKSRKTETTLKLQCLILQDPQSFTSYDRTLCHTCNRFMPGKCSENRSMRGELICVGASGAMTYTLLSHKG
jgi:hypothetical protein